MKRSMGIVIPYFGEWEPWAPLFFETVRRNPTIDFLVFTDRDVPGPSAPNVRTRRMSFDDYVALANDRIDIPFAPGSAYKLCDLRPLFGHIHSDDLREYEFYGWCDVDVLFGDIRAFYTDEILDRYDVLSTHEDRISGHFAVFRNTPRNREMYRRIYALDEHLRNPEFVGLDEHGITNAYLMTVVDKANEKFGMEVDNVATRFLAGRRRRGILLKEQFTTPFVPRPWLDGSTHSGQPEAWTYRDGHITNSRDGSREFIYLHFMNFKSSRWRHDGTPAPWEGLDRVCTATVEDMARGIVIDPAGIRPLEPRGP